MTHKYVCVKRPRHRAGSPSENPNDEYTALLSRLSGVYHDMKLPLQMQLNAARLIEIKVRNRSGEILGHIQGDIESIIDNNYRMLRMVDNMVDYTRLQNGQKKLFSAHCDVAECVRTLVKQALSYAEGRSIALEVDCPESPLIASVDLMQFERMVLNLLSNAFKYTPKGGTVFVRLQCEADAFLLTVSDTGCVIPPERLRSIFDPFYTSEQDSLRGTGLGLCLVRQMARLHGGDATVSSQPGKGSRFTITLPLRSDEQTDSLLTPLNAASERVRAELS